MNGVKPSETMTVFYKTIVITDEEELFNLWEEWERDQFTSCDVAWALANESWSLGITKKDKPLIQNELAVSFCVLRSPRFGAGERVRSFVRRPSECDRSVTHAGCCSEGCEYRCCDARYELHDPLEGFLLSHSLPPSLYRLLHVAAATGIAASALLFFFFDILPSPFCWLHDVC